MLRHTVWGIAVSLLISGRAVAAPALAQHDGAVDITDGARVLATVKPVTPALRRGMPVLREHRLDAGHRIVELRIPVRGTPAEELWLGEVLTTGKLRPIWTGVTGPRDADGESSLAVEVVDGRILEYQKAVQVTRCDGQPIRLFPRAWDFGKGQFVSVPQTLPPPPAQQLQVSRASKDAPAAAQMLHTFRWSSASSSAGADGDARTLTAPRAVDDDSVATAWTTPGDGRGEFLSARTSAGAVRVIGLYVLPGHAATVDTFKRHRRPQALRLLLGPRPEQQFLVRLVEDDKNPSVPYWVPLPQPIETACVTVVIDATSAATAGQAPATAERAMTAISGLEVVTEMDGAGGPERLASAMATGENCPGRVPLMVSFGKAALQPAAQAAAHATGLGRECLVEALTKLEPAPAQADVVQALVGALRGSSQREEQLASAALGRAPAAVPALAALVADQHATDQDRARAARVLARMDDGEKAARALLAATGQGSPAFRAELVAVAGSCRQLEPETIAEQLRQEPQAPVARRGDLLRLLAARAHTDASAAERAVAVIHDVLSSTQDFELQARGVMALGALGQHAAAVGELASLRGSHADPTLRFLATRELAGTRRAEVVAPLRLALADGDPRVRETAATALGARKDKESAAALIVAGKQEPWPFARRAEVDAIGRLCTGDGADLLARAAEVDVPEVRAAAMAGLVRCRDTRAPGLLMNVLDRRPEAAGLREAAARLLGQVRAPDLTARLAASIRRILGESQDDMALEAVAAAALPSLARQGGPQAVTTAAELSTDSRPVVRRAAVEALGILCDPGAGAAALHAAATGQDTAVATLASSVEKRCAAAASKKQR